VGIRRRATDTAADHASDADASAVFASPADAALASLGSRPEGLTSAEARERLARYGPNTLAGERRAEPLVLLARQFTSPIVLILVVATVLSGVLGELTDAAIILAIIVLSGLLGFWQERGATRAVSALLAAVRVHADVRRDGTLAEVPLEDVVPGDVLDLNAGDVIPADCLVLQANALLVDQAALTGETYPVDKSPGMVAADAPIAERTNALFMGTHVVSGSGSALVVVTGTATRFGRVSSRVANRATASGFEQGMTQFGYLLVRAMLVMVGAVLVINVVLGRPILDSVLFSLALAVGLTPQLLPAIVTISLSQGARRMAAERVIVKRLDAIEDFGAMTVLCTDKTGTMTSGTVELAAALDPEGQASPEVLRLAALNARLQTGFGNPIDAAIDQAAPAAAGGATRVDELPYDFTRKRLSVLVRDGDVTRLVTKGAFESVLQACDRVGAPSGATRPIDQARAGLLARYADLSGQGYRVLGLATREAGDLARLAPGDEAGMVLVGLLTFLDPPKPDAREVLGELAQAGISVRMITGDNRLVAAHVGGMVGLDATAVMTGADIGALDDAALAARAPDVAIFAEVDPIDKERVIRALRASGRVVGYLGDGINDAPALHVADVGISVDTAVDVAREAAAIVLLERDLRVLLHGVREGRRTFANTLKYVYTTISANFGNVASMVVAAAVLPFLPLLAGQILLINFLTDIPSTTIATDEVDPEQLERPGRWDIVAVRRFMVLFGSLSSVFDLITFAVLRVGFSADATLFRSGWFIESALSELAVLFVLRTRRVFFRSRPGRLLVLSSLLLAALTLAIPYGPWADDLGLEAPPPSVLAALLLVTAGYVVAAELVKERFYRRPAAVASAMIAPAR